MNQRLQAILDKVRVRGYAEYRTQPAPDMTAVLAEGSATRRSALRLAAMLKAEKPLVWPDERICYVRTVPTIPAIYTEAEWAAIKAGHFMFEDAAVVCNINSDYGTTIAKGLNARRAEVEKALERFSAENNAEAMDLLESVLITIDAVLGFAARYAAKAESQGNAEMAALLRRVPANGAATFHEALQFFRILNYTLWINGNYHITVGRLDQTLYPYYKADVDAGRLGEAEAYELLLEFFLSLNKDSDLYTGVQQGDNGQSLVLGGCDENGADAYNQLSELCLKASAELKVIDPKINLRVSKSTPVERYKLGTELTAQGLGFPQYSNDDVVIPALVAKGYSLQDARNYVVAACWEFIIPGKGTDIPNIGAVNFPEVVNRCVRTKLLDCGSFDDFLAVVRAAIFEAIEAMLPRYTGLFFTPSPFQSLLMDGCIESGRDVSKGAKYNNFGLHGVGIASATDALAAVKALVYEAKAVGKPELLDALDKNFEGYEGMQALLVGEAPKMGNGDDAADDLACWLVDTFDAALAGKKNERGGIWRAGTGTAMYYLWHAGNLGATADGRKAGEPFGANFSPSLQVRPKGPLSVITSFSKPDFTKAMNGGPLTLELHDTVFRNDEGKTKVAMLVKSFIDMGGHQMQLNAISAEQLREAQRRPQQYRSLIVRVWGWSGYFVELDKEYQDHILRRVEFMA